MELQLVVFLSIVAAACTATIQDPFIHDSVEDQIAMESGSQDSVVVAPPHMLQGDSENPTPEEPEEDNVSEQELDKDQKPSEPRPSFFSIISNERPSRLPSRRPQRPQLFSSPLQTGVRRPGMQQLLSPYQSAFQPSYQPAFQPAYQQAFQPSYRPYGYGNTVILLQPIYVPVPMSDGEPADDQAVAASVQSQLETYFGQPAVRRPSLLDILQRGYYGF